QGMLWLARTLELAPAGETDLVRVARINLDGWRRRLAPLKAILSHQGDVVAISPDGTRILTAGQDPNGRQGTAQLWDVATLQPIGPLLTLPDRVRSAFFGLGGKRFVTAARTRVQIWDTTTRMPVGDPIPTLIHDVPDSGFIDKLSDHVPGCGADDKT